jgi:hypothetical protein
MQSEILSELTHVRKLGHTAALVLELPNETCSCNGIILYDVIKDGIQVASG